MDKSTFGKKKVPNKFEEGGTVLTEKERLTSAEAYGVRNPPQRKALFSETHPYRKRKSDKREQHVSNAKWRKPSHSSQKPNRKRT